MIIMTWVCSFVKVYTERRRWHGLQRAERSLSQQPGGAHSTGPVGHKPRNHVPLPSAVQAFSVRSTRVCISRCMPPDAGSSSCPSSLPGWDEPLTAPAKPALRWASIPGLQGQAVLLVQLGTPSGSHPVPSCPALQSNC